MDLIEPGFLDIQGANDQGILHGFLDIKGGGTDIIVTLTEEF